jgi:hypothetical protein
MNEKFLHFIWKHQLFEKKDLQTTDQDLFEIKYVGKHNDDAGPDFLEAKIIIAGTLWAGHVEIHLSSSDYLRHKHQLDAAYQNVILHVVYEDDLPKSALPFPTFVLKGLIPLHFIRNHEQLLSSKDWIACGKSICQVPSITWQHTYARLITERLERKTRAIEKVVIDNQYDWEETFYQLLCRCFGMKVNADVFFELSKKVPLKLIAKHRLSLLQIEALLLGTAGLLQLIVEDAYIIQLQNQYAHLKHLYQLTPLNASQWKFSRMRPANFPTIKIAQLAALLHQRSLLFSRITQKSDWNMLRPLFDTKASEYWTQHYQCDVLSVKKEKHLSAATQDLILINTIVPILFSYSFYTDDESMRMYALQLLEHANAENNKTIRQWNKSGIKIQNALQSQALLELKNEYCESLQCEKCLIGMKVIQMGN